MTKNTFQLTLTTLTLAAMLGTASPSGAQAAGGTARANLNVIESTQLAMGWSVKETLLGKTISTDAGQKVGKVDDRISSLDRNESYVIVGAGGFIGIGRHDVVIPATLLQDRAGKLVVASASKDTIKAMLECTCATDTATRDQFVATAEADIANGKAKAAELEKKGHCGVRRRQDEDRPADRGTSERPDIG